MRNSRPHVRDSSKWVVTSVFIFCALTVVGYGLFEGRRLLQGPKISIYSPTDGSSTSTTAVLVSGVAHNVSFLTLDDQPAFTDESGYFAVTLSPPPGYTVVTVAAVDRFGRRASKSVSLNVFNYCPNTT